MAKIIEFPTKAEKHELYNKYYITATSIDQWYIRQTVALNLTSRYDVGYDRIKKWLSENELKRILGACAAWWRDKSYLSEYTREIALTRYKVGMMKNVKSN